MKIREQTAHFQICGYRAVVRLYQAGKKDVPTIIALHGFTGSGRDFDRIRGTPDLAQFNWICPDFMGHGASDSPRLIDPYALQETIQLIDWCRALAPDPEKVSILGYSMGGRVALHYLYRRPPLPCTLISSSPGLEKREARLERQAHDRSLADLLLTHGIEGFCDLWEKQPLIEPQTKLEEPWAEFISKRRRENNPHGLAHSLLALGTGFVPHLWDKISRLGPIHLVFGKEDSKFAELSQAMCARNPAFRSTGIPRCGHAPHLEAPEALAACLNYQLL